MKRENQTAKSAEHAKVDPMTNSLSDEELMFHVRNGVGESLGELFSRYQDPLTIQRVIHTARTIAIIHSARFMCLS